MQLRRLLTWLLAVAVVLALAGTAAGLGQKGPQSYYLALGDSIAYGIQPGKGGAPPTFDTGYVDLFAARLRKLSPKLKLVNYGCPGESTVTFARGGCEWLRDGQKLHDPFRGAQLKAALSFLRAHKGQVSPITLTLWGNDLAPLSARGKGAPKAIASFASRFDSILEQLRSAAPTAEIIVTGAWNPEVDQVQEDRAAVPLARRSHRTNRSRFASTGRKDVCRSSTRPGTSDGSARSRTSARWAIRIRMTPDTGQWRTRSSLPPATRESPSRRGIPLLGAYGEIGDDLAEHRGVGVDVCQTLVRLVGGLGHEAPRAVRTVDEEVAVLVQHVVDDLEQQPELLAELVARPAAREREPRPPTEHNPTEAAKSRPVFSRCSTARSCTSPWMSRCCPPIMPSVASASSRVTSAVG